jgi:ABC-2 type transport system ATP-binding protein
MLSSLDNTQLRPSETDDFVIDVRGLARTYKSYKKSEGLWNSVRGLWRREFIEVEALKPTSFQIPAGQIVGLVGANGAGKTTLLKALSGLIHPSSGDARVLGYKPWERKNDFLKQISLLLGQKNQLWWDISPADSFELLRKIYDVDKGIAQKRVQELSEILQCTHVLNIQLRRLSLGERMKMELIGALLHQPRVLFLDEPTIGLDIVAQTSIRKFLENYVRKQRPTIILTSHYMDDITELADRLLLMSKGCLVYDGSVAGFISKSLKSKNEEVDFESVIHEFLEKESRV